MKSRARPINRGEWAEIAALPAVQKAFGSKHIWGSNLAEIVYGAKFDLSSDEDEVAIYTLVALIAKKEVTVVVQATNGTFKEIRNGKMVS